MANRVKQHKTLGRWGEYLFQKYHYLVSNLSKRVNSDGGRVDSVKAMECSSDIVDDLDSNDILSDASVIITANAVKAGVLYAVKPYGSITNVITNGDFSSGLTGWSITGSVVASAGVCTLGVTLGANTLYQSALTTGLDYDVTFDVISYTGTVVVKDDDGTVLHTIVATGATSFSFTHAALGGNIIFETFTANAELTIDNISVVTVVSGDMTWTRAGDSKRVNEDLLVEDVVAGVPRLDYPLDGGCPHVLVEPQRTNIVVYSNTFENAAWSKANSVLTDNNVTGVDGTLSASKMNDSATGGTGSGNIARFAFTVNSGDNTISLFAKKGSLSWIRISNASYDVGGTGDVYFDLDNGVVGTETTITGSIEDYGNGWYRCAIHFNTTVDLTGALYIAFAASDGVTTVPLDGTSNLYITEANCTEGAHVTTPITTLDSSVTRIADAGTGSGNSTTFNSEAGVLFVDTATLYDTLTDREISLSDGTVNNRVLLRYSTVSNTIVGIYTVGGVAQCTLSYVLPDETAFSKIAIRWAVNDFSLWANGVERSVDGTGTVLAANVLTSLQLNGGAGANPFYGKFKTIDVLDFLTDAEMALLIT